jgi:isopenicillin N synthase-like dioxygenase
MSSSGSNNTLATILGTTLAVGTVSSLGWYFYFTSKEQRDRCMSQPQQHIRSYQNYKPPFPPRIRNMLSKCSLAYLSTIDADLSSSHLSLMRFTYLHDPEDGEVVIMSTNRKTKKFDMLQQQKGVALLVHDFVNSDQNEDGDDATYSITLNGTCRILPFGEKKTEHYRQAHLQHNPDYPQFIVGDDIEILCIDVTSARICDIQDCVVKWDVTQQDDATATNAETTTATATGPKVVSKDLVQISYSELQAIMLGGGFSRSSPSDFVPRMGGAGLGDNVTQNRLAYSDLRKAFSTQDLQENLENLLDKLREAFDQNGLGFLEITGIPPEMVKLRTKLLPQAERLASLPKNELVNLERPDLGYTIGWSHGKEHFKDGTYDTAKGSFYVDPFFELKAGNPNVYPLSLQPNLEKDLMTMTRFMSHVGMQIATLCDLYLQREKATTDGEPWMISKSLASGSRAKARLLYYFPKTEPLQQNARKAPVFDDWCGQHKDHSTITSLLPGMLCENSATFNNGSSSPPTNDPYPPGLYIENRQKELVHASLAPTSLGFQLGETLQIMSKGKFRATPHSVKAPTSAAARAVGRASLAVFLQPLPDQVLPPLPPNEIRYEADDKFALRSRWRSTFGEFQKATTDTFN